MLDALCYVCVPNTDKLTIWTFQLELGEFAPGLEPLEFVSGECSSTVFKLIFSTAATKRYCALRPMSVLQDSKHWTPQWNLFT